MISKIKTIKIVCPSIYVLLRNSVVVITVAHSGLLST